MDGCQGDLFALPPVQLGDLGNPAFFKPCLVAQWGEVVGFGKLFLQPLDGGVAQVIIMVMADDHGIDKRQLFDFTGRRRVASKAFERNGRTAVLEYRVEEDAKAAGKFNIVTRMTQPGRT